MDSKVMSPIRAAWYEVCNAVAGECHYDYYCEALQYALVKIHQGQHGTNANRKKLYKEYLREVFVNRYNSVVPESDTQYVAFLPAPRSPPLPSPPFGSARASIKFDVQSGAATGPRKYQTQAVGYGFHSIF